MLDFISLRGCRLHNLKNVDAQIPLGKITVVCGPSGCGKSTLVMDTLHGESKRRYLETLSPFAADMLGGKRSIPLDSAEGLPASLAISATRGEAPTKAYALSIAECDNALRTLFAAFAKPACPVCGAPMVSHSREGIIRIIAGKAVGTKLQFLARIETGNAEKEIPGQAGNDKKGLRRVLHEFLKGGVDLAGPQRLAAVPVVGDGHALLRFAEGVRNAGVGFQLRPELAERAECEQRLDLFLGLVEPAEDGSDPAGVAVVVAVNGVNGVVGEPHCDCRASAHGSFLSGLPPIVFPNFPARLRTPP